MTETALITHFLARYGYVAITVGTFLEGEAVLVLAGVLAHQGVLHLPLVILCAFVGSLIGDQSIFFLGRKFGAPLIKKRPFLRQKVEKARPLLDKYGWNVALGFRFIYGMRTAIPAFLGMSGMSVRVFAACNILGAGVWATTFAAAGYWMGSAVEAVWGKLGASHHTMLAGVIFVVVLVAFIFSLRLWRKRT